MVDFNVIEKHTIEVPKKFVVSLTNEECIQLVTDLRSVEMLSNAGEDLLDFLGSRNV